MPRRHESLFQVARITSSSAATIAGPSSSRSHGRRPLAYLATPREFRQELGMQVHSHCLMTNHVHLIVNPGSDPTKLGLLMKRLAGRHTRRLEQRIARAHSTATQDGRAHGK